MIEFEWDQGSGENLEARRVPFDEAAAVFSVLSPNAFAVGQFC